MVSHIVYEEEENEDIAINLRVGFKDRQRKRLSESITVNPAPFKKPCSEPICMDPISALTLMPVPLTTIGGIIPYSDEMFPSTQGTAHHEPRKPFHSLNHLSNESVECVGSFLSHPNFSHVPNWEEIAKLMR